METHTPSSELTELCGKLRDETISADEFAHLESLLVSNPESLQYYRQFAKVCSGLEQIARPDSDRENTVGDFSAGDFHWTDDLSHLAPEKQFVQPASWLVNDETLPGQDGRNRRFAVIASVVMGLAACIAFALATLRPTSSSEGFASLIDDHQAVWKDEAPAQRITGTHTLISGAAKMRFDSGAELLVQAPAEFSIDQAGLASLNRGSLRLYVPPAATGFQIQTPYGLVVDHGTRIGVFADKELGLEVHVFEGKAEAIRYQRKPKTGQPNDSEPSRTTKLLGEMLSAGQAIAIPRGRKPAKRMVANETYFSAALEQHDDLPIVSGDVQLLVSPPRSVRRINSELVDLGRAAIFSERKDFLLSEDLDVSLTAPGQAGPLEMLNQSVPAGTHVDTLMVHFALPKGKRRGPEQLTASGSIRFPRPVVGIVCHRPGRQADLVGNPDTDYPRDRDTGLEDAIDGDAKDADQIELSKDRRTVRFSLQIHGREAAEQADFVDQFRVLIESAGLETP